jgi:hypothetical protein
LYIEIIAPADAPDWAQDRQTLWQRVNTNEKRVDARLAKEIVFALPHDIPANQWLDVVRDYAQSFVDDGLVADIAIHNDGNNPHCHILLTTRSLTADGFAAKKHPRLDAYKTFVTTERRRCADTMNIYLKAAGSPVVIDPRSYAARGIDRTPGRHRGPNHHERKRSRARARERSPNQQTKEQSIMADVSHEERDKYPNLTAREDWPPTSRQPAQDMNAAETRELNRYWQDQEHLAQRVNTEHVHHRDFQRWWHEQQRARPGRDDSWQLQAVRNAGPEERRTMPDREPHLHEAAREGAERMQQVADRMWEAERATLIDSERELWLRAVAMREGATREETELMKAFEHAADPIKNDVTRMIIRQRIARLRAMDACKEHERYMREHELDPKLAERLREGLANLAPEPDRSVLDPVPGPNRELLSQRQLDEAQQRMLDDTEREQER